MKQKMQTIKFPIKLFQITFDLFAIKNEIFVINNLNLSRLFKKLLKIEKSEF